MRRKNDILSTRMSSLQLNPHDKVITACPAINSREASVPEKLANSHNSHEEGVGINNENALPQAR
jgi:hypothetical protein